MINYLQLTLNFRIANIDISNINKQSTLLFSEINFEGFFKKWFLHNFSVKFQILKLVFLKIR